MGWSDRTMWGGEFVPVAELLKGGTHRIEAWGNSREGWFPYLVTPHDGIGCQIGPYFGRDLGDTLRDLKQAAARAYGIEPRAVKLGRNWW
ncbi:hypothetical protein AncyloWKF20_07415 [Ancylobacter sp. WKF20]|uniref:hypothetical protein n=1 Tax=Ancylobacter sp. WKF20 TaxID=3039801 RepID=UPI0024346352|nr:hypothetical protein [Ancylobacter sp. WKF20]WGD31638.1 hypothetical protein AncyloWKF20_07415 [Ancylobacter sp. WKF20]